MASALKSVFLLTTRFLLLAMDFMFQELCGAIVTANMKLASDPCSVKYSRLTVRMIKALSVSQESLERQDKFVKPSITMAMCD
jgi:hypothetical protein